MKWKKSTSILLLRLVVLLLLLFGSYALYCDKANNYIRPLNNKKEIPANWKSQLSAGAALCNFKVSYLGQ